MTRYETSFFSISFQSGIKGQIKKHLRVVGGRFPEIVLNLNVPGKRVVAALHVPMAFSVTVPIRFEVVKELRTQRFPFETC